MSGTYKCAKSKVYQAGLPLDKLWVLGTTGDSQAHEIWVCRDGKVLMKVLTHSEEDFRLEQAQWRKLRDAWLTNNPEAGASLDTLRFMVTERKMAVDAHGYLFDVE